MKLRDASTDDIITIKKLYKTAFPRKDRTLFKGLINRKERGHSDILSIVNNDGEFSGFLITVHHQDLLLIDYFAIAENARGGGIGSQALQLVEDKYAGKRIFLFIEMLEESASNYRQRVSRKNFYLRNGYVDNGLRLKAGGANYEIMDREAFVSFDEFMALFNHTSNRFEKLFMKPKVLQDIHPSAQPEK